MKITETITRDCCRWPGDLVLFQGQVKSQFKAWSKIYFCLHCGQLWTMHRAAGELDAGLEKITISGMDLP